MTSAPSPTATVTDSQENKVKADDVKDGTDTPIPVQFEHTKDFGFLPIPRRLRYDPVKPPHFGLGLNIGFGFASTFSK